LTYDESYITYDTESYITDDTIGIRLDKNNWYLRVSHLQLPMA
jgi:hypothetical protein